MPSPTHAPLLHPMIASNELNISCRQRRIDITMDEDYNEPNWESESSAKKLVFSDLSNDINPSWHNDTELIPDNTIVNTENEDFTREKVEEVKEEAKEEEEEKEEHNSSYSNEEIDSDVEQIIELEKPEEQYTINKISDQDIVKSDIRNMSDSTVSTPPILLDSDDALQEELEDNEEEIINEALEIKLDDLNSENNITESVSIDTLREHDDSTEELEASLLSEKLNIDVEPIPQTSSPRESITGTDDNTKSHSINGTSTDKSNSRKDIATKQKKLIEEITKSQELLKDLVAQYATIRKEYITQESETQILAKYVDNLMETTTKMPVTSSSKAGSSSMKR